MFDLFATKFGRAGQDTASSLAALALPPSTELESFESEVGFGVFRGGLFSLVVEDQRRVYREWQANQGKREP